MPAWSASGMKPRTDDAVRYKSGVGTLIVPATGIGELKIVSDGMCVEEFGVGTFCASYKFNLAERIWEGKP